MGSSIVGALRSPAAAPPSPNSTPRASRVYYFTNNSTRSRESYVELLAELRHRLRPRAHRHLRLPHRASTCGTSTRAIADDPGGGRGGAAGGAARGPGSGWCAACRSAGWTWWWWGWTASSPTPRCIAAQQALLAGAEFIATNRDATYPVEGNVIPGGGSIVAAVAAAAEREPITMGKPSRVVRPADRPPRGGRARRRR